METGVLLGCPGVVRGFTYVITPPIPIEVTGSKGKLVDVLFLKPVDARFVLITA